MQDADKADQLREHYKFDRWMRKRKWWWSVLFWGMEVMMVNAYLCYVKFQIMNGKKKSECMSHNDFRRQIALAWIDPDTYWPDRYKAAANQKKINVVS